MSPVRSSWRSTSPAPDEPAHQIRSRRTRLSGPAERGAPRTPGDRGIADHVCGRAVAGPARAFTLCRRLRAERRHAPRRPRSSPTDGRCRCAGPQHDRGRGQRDGQGTPDDRLADHRTRGVPLQCTAMEHATSMLHVATAIIEQRTQSTAPAARPKPDDEPRHRTKLCGFNRHRAGPVAGSTAGTAPCWSSPSSPDCPPPGEGRCRLPLPRTVGCKAFSYQPPVFGLAPSGRAICFLTRYSRAWFGEDWHWSTGAAVSCPAGSGAARRACR